MPPSQEGFLDLPLLTPAILTIHHSALFAALPIPAWSVLSRSALSTYQALSKHLSGTMNETHERENKGRRESTCKGPSCPWNLRGSWTSVWPSGREMLREMLLVLLESNLLSGRGGG